MNVAEEDLTSLSEGTAGDEWRIGFILLRSGRLNKEDVGRVIQLQRQNGMRFGDAAIALGVLAEHDVRFALARQFDYPYVLHGESKISKEVIAAYQPDLAPVEAIRAVRSQLMMRWNEGGKATRALAVIGADCGIGRSWLSANLAVTFSQLGRDTILIDGDLRNPAQHRFFGIDARQGLSEVLCGRAKLTSVLKRNRVLPNLLVMTSGALPPNPQEVIASRGFDELLDSLKETAEVIIVDTPADNVASDGLILAKFTQRALLIARRHHSQVHRLKRYIERIKESGTEIAASVLVG